MHRVIAAPGLRVPHEHDSRSYIESKPTDVPDSTYYRRRIASGELLLAAGEQTTADATSPKKGSKA